MLFSRSSADSEQSEAPCAKAAQEFDIVLRADTFSFNEDIVAFDSEQRVRDTRGNGDQVSKCEPDKSKYALKPDRKKETGAVSCQMQGRHMPEQYNQADAPQEMNSRTHDAGTGIPPRPGPQLKLARREEHVIAVDYRMFLVHGKSKILTGKDKSPVNKENYRQYLLDIKSGCITV